MKKSVEIIGLPVISIVEGIELGIVKDLVLNHQNGTIDGLVIDDGKWYLGAKVLPFSAIAGIGEDALTIEDSTSIGAVTEESDWAKRFAEDYKIIGNKVLTKAGKIQGIIAEIQIDEQGRILNCDVKDASEVKELSADRILTFGKRVIIVAPEGEKAVRKSDVAMSVTSNPVSQQTGGAKDNTESTARIFDEKQRKYILGKKASRTITTDNGVVIVEQGTEITEEVIQKAKLAGKFVELSMSIQ